LRREFVFSEVSIKCGAVQLINTAIDRHGTIGRHSALRHQFRIAWIQGEWLSLDRFADRTTANALRTHSDRSISTRWKRNLHTLQVGFELSASDAGDLGTNSAQILRFTAGLDRIPDSRALPAHLTFSSHNNVPFFAILSSIANR
jgi:hypothetical protein